MSSTFERRGFSSGVGIAGEIPRAHESDNVVRTYEARDIRAPGPLVYQTPTLANHGRASSEVPRRDRRFSIDPLLKGLMPNDEETENRVESQVAERVAVLRFDAEREARDEGHAEGFAEGMHLALEQYRAESDLKLNALDALVRSFEGSKNEIFAAQERFLVDLTLRTAAVVMRRELTADPEYIQRTIRTVVDEMGARESLKIWVSSAQLERVRAMRPELEASLAHLQNLQIEANPSLTSLDCVVETDWNRMDASFDTQVSLIHDRVLAKVDRDSVERSEARGAHPSDASDPESQTS